jgi:hypothetical protein
VNHSVSHMLIGCFTITTHYDDAALLRGRCTLPLARTWCTILFSTPVFFWVVQFLLSSWWGGGLSLFSFRCISCSWLSSLHLQFLGQPLYTGTSPNLSLYRKCFELLKSSILGFIIFFTATMNRESPSSGQQIRQ